MQNKNSLPLTAWPLDLVRFNVWIGTLNFPTESGWIWDSFISFITIPWEHTKVHVPFQNWVWILLGLLGMIMDQRRPPVRPSCATTNAASTTTAETKTKTSNETEEKLVYYILFHWSPSDERARTMTMYYLPSPEFVVTACDGISSSAFVAPHPAAMVEKCFWRLILLVFCA